MDYKTNEILILEDLENKVYDLYEDLAYFRDQVVELQMLLDGELREIRRLKNEIAP